MGYAHLNSQKNVLSARGIDKVKFGESDRTDIRHLA